MIKHKNIVPSFPCAEGQAVKGQSLKVIAIICRSFPVTGWCRVQFHNVESGGKTYFLTPLVFVGGTRKGSREHDEIFW